MYTSFIKKKNLMSKIKDENLLNKKKKKYHLNDFLILEGLKISNYLTSLINCLEVK